VLPAEQAYGAVLNALGDEVDADGGAVAWIRAPVGTQRYSLVVMNADTRG
jgi:hypothetical protein